MDLDQILTRSMILPDGPVDIRKHMGPGKHPSGSGQEVHSRSGGSSSASSPDPDPDPDPDPSGPVPHQQDLLDENQRRLDSWYDDNPMAEEIAAVPGLIEKAEEIFHDKILADEALISPIVAGAMVDLDGQFTGWKHRVKYETSIRDKLFRYMSEGFSLDRAAAKLKDGVRYTMLFDSASYTESWEEVKSHIRSMGFDLMVDSEGRPLERNMFAPGDFYDGLNTVWTNGEVTFEIQVHTPGSHDLKNQVHPLYTQCRSLPMNDPHREELQEQMRRIMNTTRAHVPVGWERIGVVMPVALVAKLLKRGVGPLTYWYRDEEGRIYRESAGKCERYSDGAWEEMPIGFAVSAYGVGGDSDFYPITREDGERLTAAPKPQAKRGLRRNLRRQLVPDPVAKVLADRRFAPTVEISKTDEAKNQVFGWASVVHKGGAQLFDLQGHAIDTDELEAAAYNFVVNYRKTGEMHTGEGLGEMIESMVFTPEKIERLGLPADFPVGWWVGFKVPPDVFAKVRSGIYKMFSIQGGAVLVPVEDDA